MKGIELLETSLETWKICFQSLKYKVFVSVRINVDNCMARNPQNGEDLSVKNNRNNRNLCRMFKAELRPFQAINSAKNKKLPLKSVDWTADTSESTPTLRRTFHEDNGLQSAMAGQCIVIKIGMASRHPHNRSIHMCCNISLLSQDSYIKKTLHASLASLVLN